MSGHIRSAFAVLLAAVPIGAIGANCGHDIHGAVKFEEMKMVPNNGILVYYSPATLVMENKSDPRHRAFGECRGQGVMAEGVTTWVGGCYWKASDADVAWVTWYSKPGDVGTEKADRPSGTSIWRGTGKMAFLNGKTGKWTGLANGGSYFCDD